MTLLTAEDPYRENMALVLIAVKERLGCTWTALAGHLDMDYVDLAQVRNPGRRRKLSHPQLSRLFSLIIKHDLSDIWQRIQIDGVEEQSDEDLQRLAHRQLYGFYRQAQRGYRPTTTRSQSQMSAGFRR